MAFQAFNFGKRLGISVGVTGTPSPVTPVGRIERESLPSIAGGTGYGPIYGPVYGPGEGGGDEGGGSKGGSHEGGPFADPFAPYEGGLPVDFGDVPWRSYIERYYQSKSKETGWSGHSDSGHQDEPDPWIPEQKKEYKNPYFKWWKDGGSDTCSDEQKKMIVDATRQAYENVKECLVGFPEDWQLVEQISALLANKSILLHAISIIVLILLPEQVK